jgi:hypothetical protein
MELVDGYFGPLVRAKLAGQRKARDWHITPCNDGTILVQSDGAIGRFDFRTRKGVINIKGGYFPHLSSVMGAKPYEFPAEFVRLALEACPAEDSVTEVGGIIIENTVKVIS